VAFFVSKIGILSLLASITGFYAYFRSGNNTYIVANDRVEIQQWKTVVRDEDVYETRYKKMGRYTDSDIISLKKQKNRYEKKNKKEQEDRLKRVKLHTQYEHNNDSRYKKHKKSQDFLQLIASVKSPVYEYDRLQTSDIFVDDTQKFFRDRKELKRSWARRYPRWRRHFNRLKKFQRVYVSYNMKGPKAMGAVQVLTIARTNTPYRYNYMPFSRNFDRRYIPRTWVDQNIKVVVNQTIIFKDTDIHSLSVKGNRLYLAGATSNKKFKTPSMLEVIPLTRNGLIRKNIAPRELTSLHLQRHRSSKRIIRSLLLWETWKVAS